MIQEQPRVYAQYNNIHPKIDSSKKISRNLNWIHRNDQQSMTNMNPSSIFTKTQHNSWIEQKYISSSNLKTAYLLNYSTKSCDSKLNVLRNKRSTKYISWFWEIRDSCSYLFLKKVVEQWLFWCYELEQMQTHAPNDEWWRCLGLKQLGLASITLCHWWCFGKTVV